MSRFKDYVDSDLRKGLDYFDIRCVAAAGYDADASYPRMRNGTACDGCVAKVRELVDDGRRPFDVSDDWFEAVVEKLREIKG